MTSDGSKHNGSGNGHDKQDDEKVVSFPTLAERDRARREKAAQEKAWQKQYKKDQKASEPPFINLDKISPFIGFLMLAFVVVHLPLYLIVSDGDKLKAFYHLGFVPGAFTGTFDFSWYTPFTVITHMFIHGSWMHLIFNGVMTLALGIFVEREIGTRRAAIFFFACGLVGAACYFVFAPFTNVPVIGASGGSSGFFGAVLILLYQRNQMGALGKRGVWPIIGFWVIFMIVIGLFSGPAVAWQAHVGGFLTGVALIRGLQKGILKF